MKDQLKNEKCLEKEIEDLKQQNNELKAQYEKDMRALRQTELIKNIQYKIADAFVNTDKLEALFESVRSQLSGLFDTTNFYIAFYDEKTDMFYSPFEKDEKDSIPRWQADKSLTGLVLKRKQSLLLNKNEINKLAESKEVEFIGTMCKSWLGVPLQTGNKVIGALVVQSYDNPNAYNKTSKEVLETLANQLSIYIERKNAEKALKESEKRYRSLLENAFDGIYILHGKNFVYVNDRFCEITGYSKEDLLCTHFNLTHMLTEESREIIEKRYNERLKGKEVSSLVEFQIFTKPGIIKDIQVSNTALSIDEEPRVLGIMRDITELKRANALEQEIAVARKSVEFKQNFLANISHEIRTPLTGVLGMAEVLEKTNLSQKQANYLNTLIQSGENLREIIDLILDYSKIESGAIKLKKNTFSLEKLFNDANNMFSPQIIKKEIKLETCINPQIPKFLTSDRQRINQVLNNLLSNAVKFTEKGKISVEATLTDNKEKNKLLTIEEDDIFIKIEVKDTGKGISDKEKEHLFKPFSLFEQHSIRKIEGTGLGLAICKELTSLLEGDIGVESQPGVGSNFWFTFKAKPVNDDKNNIGNENYNNKKTTRALNILCVEDKKVTQKVIILLLNSLGHKVDIANDGEEALKMFKPEKYDLVLMDIQMPVMDGITATKSLREKHSNLPPIVGLSANAFEGDRKKYMDLGLDEYLTKPVKEEDFVKILQKFNIA